jgi:hypothetical protein
MHPLLGLIVTFEKGDSPMKGRFFRWTTAFLCAALFCTMLPAAWAADDAVTYKAQEAVGPSGLTAPLTKTENTMYTAASDTLYQLGADGASKNKAILDGKAESGVSIAVSNGNVYVALMDGTVQCLGTDLSKKWTNKVEGTIQSMAANADTVYVGTSSNTIYALQDPDETEQTDSWSVDGYTAVCYAADNVILCQAADGALTLVSSESKEAVESASISGNIRLPVVENNGTLYFATSKAIYSAAIDTGNQKLKNVTQLVQADALCAPAVTDSGIYFVQSDGVYFYDGSQSERIYEASISGTASVAVNGDAILLEKDGKLIPLQPEEEPETVTPEVSATKVQRDKQDETKAAVTLTANVDGTLYYAVGDSEPDVFGGKQTMKVTAGENTLQLTDLAKSEQTLWIGLQTEDGTKSEIISVTIPKGTEETVVPTEKAKKISNISASRTVKYTNKKDADVSKVTVTFTTNFKGTVYYTTSKSLSKNIKTQGTKKSVTSGKNTIKLSNSSDETLWIGWEDSDGEIQTKKVDLDPPTVYNARLTMNPDNAKVTVKYDGTKLTPQKSDTKNGKYYYQFVVGEQYQISAKVPNSTKYKEMSETLTVAKEKNYTVKLSRGDGRLSALVLNTNASNPQNSTLALSPEFSSSTEEYTAALSGSGDTAYLWLQAPKSSTKLTVKMGSKTLKATSYSGYQRYQISFGSSATKREIQITAKGADDTKNTYTVTVQRSEKFTLSLVENATKRKTENGQNQLWMTVYSPQKATGYLKVVNPGVDVPIKTLLKEGYQFQLNKGYTTLKISGLASVARDIYIIGENADGDRTPRLKVSISAVSGSSGNGSNSSNWVSNKNKNSNSSNSSNNSSNSNNKNTNSSNNSNDSNSNRASGANNSTGSSNTQADEEYNINASSWADEDGTTSNENGSELLSDFENDMNTLDENDDGTTVEIDASSESVASTQADVGSSGNGEVPNNSVISRGIPLWGIVLLLAVIAAGGFGIYWVVIRMRSQNEDLSDDQNEDP